MQIPLEIAYHNIEGSAWLDEYIQERAEHLDRVSGGLVSCRVVVERAQHQHHTGNPFRVRVEAKLPPKLDLIGDKEEVVENPQVQLRPIIRHAFDAVEKQVKKQRQMMRGDGKRNATSGHEAVAVVAENKAVVVRLFKEEGYGFLQVANDEDEYYFHRNALRQGDFEKVELGAQVKFEASMGEEGPQASSVKLVD